MGLPWHEVLFIVLLVFTGVIAGLSAGLFGIGGGTILVPALFTAFLIMGIPKATMMQNVIGTSLALIIPSGIMSVRKHASYGGFDLAYFKTWAPWVILGAIIGTFSIGLIPAHTLLTMFTIYLYICVFFGIFKQGEHGHTKNAPRGFMKCLVGTLIGGIATILGMGGGPFTVPFHVAYGYPLRKSIAISSATAVTIGIIGTIGAIVKGFGVKGLAPYSLGYVNLVAFVLVLPTAMISSPFGAKLTHIISRRKLRWIYVFFLLFVALYMTGHTLFTY